MFWIVLFNISFLLISLLIYKLIKRSRESSVYYNSYNVYTFRSVGFTKKHAKRNTNKIIKKWEKNKKKELDPVSKAFKRYIFFPLLVKAKKEMQIINKEPE